MINKIADERSAFSTVYNSKRDSLKKKKLKLFKVGDVSKYGIETSNISSDFKELESIMLPQVSI